MEPKPYLPKDEFAAQLEMGLGRIAFKQKKWVDAARIYGEVVERFPATSSVSEAIYWRGVSHYKQTKNHTALLAVAKELREKAGQSVWAKKALPSLED